MSSMVYVTDEKTIQKTVKLFSKVFFGSFFLIP